MICALYFVFVVGCCLGLLVYAGPWVFLCVLAIAAVRWVVWEHWERLERRHRKP
jgi:hypothetical protein